MSRTELHILLDLRSVEHSESEVARVRGSLSELVDAGLIAESSVHILLSDAREGAEAVWGDWEWRISFEPDVIQATSDVMLNAAMEGASLLLLRGPVSISSESIAELQAVIAEDTHFGFVFPRFARTEGDGVRKLDARFGDPTLSSIPEAAIGAGPPYDLVPDQLAPVILVRGQVVGLFEGLSQGYETLSGSLLDLVARARRTGFRCVVANRSIAFLDSSESEPALDASDRDRSRLAADYPELAILEEEWAASALHERESLRARAFSRDESLRRTMLVDLTDLGETYNGTSEAVLAFLSGLAEAEGGWKIDLLVPPGAFKFHAIAEISDRLRPVWPQPQSRYSVVFRPIQPWSIQHIERLHGFGLFVFVMMFDTILGDSAIAPELKLDLVWQTMAESADGIFYISHFTQERFRKRFAVADSVAEHVTILPTDPLEYCAQPGSGDGAFIFVVGNELPHKWVGPTIRELLEVFPGERFRTLGFSDPTIPQLEGIESGRVAPAVIDSLYRNASLIIYPSLYEGFGFPVIRGLSFGKTVVARKSDLLLEVASHYRGPGRLLGYDTRAELMEIVARCRMGYDVEPMRLGESLDPAASGISRVRFASEVLSAIEKRMAEPESSNWPRRQLMFERLAYSASTAV